MTRLFPPEPIGNELAFLDTQLQFPCCSRYAVCTIWSRKASEKADDFLRLSHGCPIQLWLFGTNERPCFSLPLPIQQIGSMTMQDNLVAIGGYHGDVFVYDLLNSNRPVVDKISQRKSRIIPELSQNDNVQLFASESVASAAAESKSEASVPELLKVKQAGKLRQSAKGLEPPRSNAAEIAMRQHEKHLQKLEKEQRIRDRMALEKRDANERRRQNRGARSDDE